MNDRSQFKKRLCSGWHREVSETRFPTWFHAYPGPSPTPSFRMWNVLEEHNENEAIRFSNLTHEMRVINPPAISGNSEVIALFCVNWLHWQLRERVWKINSFSDQHARVFKLLRPTPWQFQWWSASLLLNCDSKASAVFSSGVQRAQPHDQFSSSYGQQG